MEPITAMIGAWVGEFVTVEIAKALLSGVNSQLNRSDLDKAIKTAVKEACDREPGLFYRCERDFRFKFLQNFFKGRGLSELQKPLKNEGRPDIDVLVAAFQEAAKADNKVKEINNSYIQSWMQIFVEIYFRQTENYLRFQVAKENYFKQLANWLDDVKFAGIAVPGQEVEKSEKLAQIFVMPDVVEEVKTQIEIGIDTELLSSELSQRQQQLLWEQKQRASVGYSGSKFLASQLIIQSNSLKTVLLGAPGSGKTTLLSYFAFMLAQKQGKLLGLDAETDYLPILIRMRDLAEKADISILDYAKQFVETNMSVKCLPAGFFEYWLEDGRALILLDGLDEVVEEATRYKVVQWIENFLCQFPQNRTIITSRPAGYRRDFFRTEEFPHYELQPFDDDKVEKFINRWYDSRIQDKAEAERWKESLRKALKNKDRIKLLARNPLLLTIIALIHRYQAILPKERHKLYEKAVETLLTSWDANKWDAKKEIASYQALQYLSLYDLQRLMERLAYWIHTQGSTGDSEGGTLIACEELLDQLKKEIKRLKRIELYQAEEEAKRFLSLIRERMGLLNEQGQDCYAFVHKTFQEYLCAKEINYQADNENDFGIILDCIRSHLHNPHWREVLLLLIAQQKPKKAAKAIATILSNNSPYEQWLHRDLLFAGSCLAEDLKVVSNNEFESSMMTGWYVNFWKYLKNLNADETLTQKIIKQLVKLAVRHQIGYTRIFTQVFSTLCNLGETAFEKQALQLLKEQADKIDVRLLQKYRAELGEKKEIIAALIGQLQNENCYTRSSAAETLGQLGKGDETVTNRLLTLLQDEDWYVRSKTAETLGQFGNNSKIVKELLVLLQDKNSPVRSSAAKALGQLGKDDEIVTNRLLSLLHDEDRDVRSSTVWALGKLGKNLETVKELLTLLEDKDCDVRSSAAEALGELGKDDEIVTNRLLSLLHDEDRNVRFSAALALGELGRNDDMVINQLLILLPNEDYTIHSRAVLALGKLGRNDDIVTNQLLILLQNEDSFIRFRAAGALGQLGNKSEAIVNKLLTLLNDENSSVRSRAAEALGRIGNNSEVIVNKLLTLLKDINNSVHAVEALGQMGKDSDAVVKGLLALLQDEDIFVSYGVVKALVRLSNKSNRIIPHVARWLTKNQNSRGVDTGIDLLCRLVVRESEF